MQKNFYAAPATRRREVRADLGGLFLPGNKIPKFRCPKSLSATQKKNRLQKIGLPLGVLPHKDIEPGIQGKGLQRKIAKIGNRNLDDGHQILIGIMTCIKPRSSSD